MLPLFLTAAAVAAVTAAPPAAHGDVRFEIAAYYFPGYHADPRNEERLGKGWTEWELVRAARPRFSGHRQPRVPLWGYRDESDAHVFQQKIDAAADHGITALIFDWYWYQDAPFLNGALDRGFLKAKNRNRLKFALMWANHDWVQLFPYKRGAPRTVVYPGKVHRQVFGHVVDHVIQRYFRQSNYWTIDDKPCFSIYHLATLLDSFGSVRAARTALDQFRRRTRAAGFAGLHLNAVAWGRPLDPMTGKPIPVGQLAEQLGFDSVTSYVWVHHVRLPQLQTDYGWAQKAYFDYWDRAEHFRVPHFPNVTVGWDPSPRADQSDEYGNFGYPFTNTIANNTPERFSQALRAVRGRLEQQPEAPRVITVNSWNEWTEGRYLEPDTATRMQYLEAVRKVFPPAQKPQASIVPKTRLPATCPRRRAAGGSTSSRVFCPCVRATRRQAAAAASTGGRCCRQAHDRGETIENYPRDKPYPSPRSPATGATAASDSPRTCGCSRSRGSGRRDG